MRRLIPIFLFLMFSWAFACADDTLCGPWNGMLSFGPQKLPIVLYVSEGPDGYECRLASPMQSDQTIPAKITVRGDSIEVVADRLQARYDGVLQGGQASSAHKGTPDNNSSFIVGKFRQSGMTLDLTLRPGDYVPQRPQSPQPPFPYETREVRVVNPVDSAVLAATLTLPLQYQMPVYRSFPAVVMVTGSGLQNRDEELFGHRPFAVLAHHLALNGIITLRYDDRGYGASTGYVANATTETFASDARAALAWLRDSVAKVGTIGVLGHSEGGSIAFMLAAGSPPADHSPNVQNSRELSKTLENSRSGVQADFVVSIAGPAIPGDSILILQNRALLGGKTAQADQYIKALSRLFAYMKANPGAKSWPEMGTAIADLTLVSPEMKDNLRSIISTRNPWLDAFISYDPSETLSSVTVPVLAINGSLDKQVDATANLDALRRLLPPDSKTLIKEYPGLNHLMQHSQTGLPQEYPTIDETISPEVLSDIVHWLKSLKN